jgi:hypothetical protein
MGQLEAARFAELARLVKAGGPTVDAVAEFATVTATVGPALHPGTVANLASPVPITNACAVNPVEGHDARPRGFEQALAGESDSEGCGNLK